MNKQPTFALTRIAFGAMLVAAATAGAPAAFAEDIDIYGPQAAAGNSNLIFLLDNTSNWSANNQAWDKNDVLGKCPTVNGVRDATCAALVQSIFGSETNLKQGQVQLRTLRFVLNDMVCNATSELRINVGLAMIGSQTARSNGDSNGFIFSAVERLAGTATTAGSSCKRLIDKLNEIDARITDPQYKAPSNADYSAAMYEIFKYFGGWSNPTLANQNPTNPPPGAPMAAQGYGPVRFSRPVSIEDPRAFTDGNTTYGSPLGTTGACDNNVLAIIGNGYPNQEPNAGATRFQGLNYTPAALSGVTSDTSRMADEWAYFLRNGDVSSLAGPQFIKTYAVNTYNRQEDAAQTRLMKSMASAGDGAYYQVGGDLAALKRAFEDIVARAAAVNSVFTATTLPVSTTTQGSYLNQLFIGMFRPDGERKPRWVGNLKQYQLGLDDVGEVRVMDANNQRALVGGSGFFSPTATSFWSSESVYFDQMRSGTPATASDAPDGPVVEKGGAAQKLRTANLQGATNRRVFTLPATGAIDGTALSSVPFTNPLTGFSEAQIKWIRGENNIVDLQSESYERPGSYQNAANVVTPLGPTGARPSIHGDVLHSRPVALNYGGGDVVVYYGANDGFLRAVDGRKTGTAGGQELWSFIAPEHYPVLTRLYNNTQRLHLPATNSTGGAAERADDDDRTKSYAMDGPIGVFARYTTTGSINEAIIYAAMRRGGSAVYAFDVTSKTEPRLKFKLSNTGDFSRLGQTWSMPRPVNFPASAGGVFTDPILFMGGGYDPAEDSNSSSGVGNVVYIVNGRTGARLAALPTDYSVPADVTVVDSNRDGIYDRAYVADVRGNLYRISMTDAGGATLLQPSSWTIRKIAQLEGKVFGAPDVVPTRDFIAVMVGTGDREKPLLASTRDHFFVIKDTTLTQPDRTVSLQRENLEEVARVGGSSGTLTQLTVDPESLSLRNGCYVSLGTGGEKVVNSPFTIAGVTYFGTNRPVSQTEHTCTANLGEARAYQFSLFCGTASSTILAGGGMPPSPVGGFVTMTVGNATQLVPFVIGGGGVSRSTSSSPGSAAQGNSHEAQTPPGNVTPVRKRQYYRIHNNNR